MGTLNRRAFLALLMLVLAGVVSAQLVTTRGVPRKPVVAGGGGGGSVGVYGSGEFYEWTTNQTFSVTTGGDDRVLFVGVVTQAANGPTNVTYNGVSMTQAWNVTQAGVCRSYGYYLANPATGANNLVLKYAAAVDVIVITVALTNCNTASPIGTVVTANADSSGPITVTASSAGDGDLILDVVASYSIAPTVGANQTVLQSGKIIYTDTEYRVSSQAGSGDDVMSWTLTGSSYWACGAVPIRVKP